MSGENFDNISDKKNVLNLTFYRAEYGEIYDIECSPSEKIKDIIKKIPELKYIHFHDFIYENRILNIDLTVEEEGIHDKAKIIMINLRMNEG